MTEKTFRTFWRILALSYADQSLIWCGWLQKPMQITVVTIQINWLIDW